jgi:hypothetical protein
LRELTKRAGKKATKLPPSKKTKPPTTPKVTRKRTLPEKTTITKSRNTGVKCSCIPKKNHPQKNNLKKKPIPEKQNSPTQTQPAKTVNQPQATASNAVATVVDPTKGVEAASKAAANKKREKKIHPPRSRSGLRSQAKNV